MWQTLSIILENGLILSLLMLWGSKPVQANLKLKYITAERLAQQSESPDALRAAAEKAYREGDRLFYEGSAESLKVALVKYSEALELYRAAGDRSQEAIILNNIGKVYSDLGEQEKAFDSYNQSLALYRALGDRKGEAVTLNKIGDVCDLLNQPQKALEYYNQSLAISRALGDHSQEGDTLYNIGYVYQHLGEKQKALEYYNQSLALYRAVGDRSGIGLSLTSIGYVYDLLGEKQKALDSYNQLLVLYRDEGDRSGVGLTLTSIGDVYYKLGEKQKALDFYNQSLRLYRAVGDRSEEAKTLTTIGDVYYELGEPQKALDSYNQSLSISRAVGDSLRDSFASHYREAVTLNNIGLVYTSLGEYQKALDSYNQSLAISRDRGYRSQEAVTLNNIGIFYYDLGEYQKALDSYNQSLASSRDRDERVLEAVSLTGIGTVYDYLGEKQKALDSYNQSLPILQAVGDRYQEAVALHNIGKVYSDLGEKQKALDYYNQSLPISRAVGSRSLEAFILHKIGKVYSNLGEKQKALDYYSQSLLIFRAVGDKGGEARTLYNIAAAERDRGNLNESLTQIEAAIKIIEDLRTKIDSSELRASYFSTVQDAYEFYIDLLMQLHKNNPSKGYDALALQVSERARARSLLEILTEANADIRGGVDPQLLEQERTIEQQLDFLEKQRIKLFSGNPTEPQKAELEKQTEAILWQYQNLQAQIRTKSPGYAALTQPQPLNLQQIQQQIVDEDTLLLEYSLGEKRSYLWAVSKTGISSYELPPRAEIEKAARDFQIALTSPIKRTNPPLVVKAANTLSEIILKPIADSLAQKRLLIVADGALQYIPFSAIAVPGKSEVPLIVEHEIVALPSASTLAIIRRDTALRQKAPKTLAVLADPIFGSDDERLKGNPTVASNSGALPIETQQLQRAAADAGIEWTRLPFTQVEANQILALVPDTEEKQALGFAANRESATNPELSQYRIIHFATHGFANSENPELSGLVLSLLDEKSVPQNGYLRLRDIYNLNLPVELIVLSACQSGLGKNIKGEGLVGLTRGFMYAGAPRVVVSLWSVNDQATSELMVRFYQKMFKNGLAPAAALRAAQIEMLQQTEWKSPYFWAAFGLQGEWK